MELSRLSTDALASFAVFADHLNFTRAAEELHISQPALHVKVQKLAETLGRPLYTRHGRRLALTPTGVEVARFARDLDGRVAAFLAGVHGTAPTRVPALAAGEGAYLYLLGDVVRPGIRLINGDRARTLAAVRTGRADLGVSVLDVMPADVDAVPLATYPQVLVMPDDHPLAERPDLILTDLAGASLVAPPPTGPHRIALERALRAAGVPWSLAVEAEGWPLTLHFVSLGIGLAIVNGCVTPPPGLVTREIIDLPAVPYHALHLPSRADDPLVTGLLAEIRTALEKRQCTSKPPSTSTPLPKPSGNS
ncbi:LysR family transcriptional regulator [Actinomadura sp. 6K520]|uniref:LysR family transcriptional regulator n=1 Tax=Actinomadura sp. 6K520 TaxID=2530364 RepID=UPI001043C4ED|nr:LysR family transcriptional regulator [Actinomadura sp. 6K520]TDE32294.1 LysR family transcriptional regulator [Actinomadura sp. 6K520]